MQNENECNKCNENEFELDGVTYVAHANETCEGCSFRGNDKCVSHLRPACASGYRTDGISVIFVKKPESKLELEKEDKMQTSEAKQYAASDKSKEYWGIICDAYFGSTGVLIYVEDYGWVEPEGYDPTRTQDWLNYDWRIKPKNRAVTLEIPEDLEIKCSMYDTTYNGLHELRIYCKDKEILAKISKAILKS